MLCTRTVPKLLYSSLLQFFPVDQKCIWGLLTLEHMLLMCQGGGLGNGGELELPGGGLPQDTPISHLLGDDEARIHQVPFSFDLIRLLPMCQQVELLVSTYIQGWSSYPPSC